MIGVVETRLALLRPVGTVMRHIERWLARRRAQRTYDELMALNDATLRDIGVERSEIQRVAFLEPLSRQHDV